MSRAALVIEGTFDKVPDDSWRERLHNARARMAERAIPAFIDFCKEVAAFREDCDNTQGGSEFQRLGCEWLNVTPATLHRWAAVGKRAPELLGAPNCLPASEDSICRIASLDDLAFKRALPKLKPDMAQKEVRELVKQVQPPRAQTEADQDLAAERKRIRLYKAFRELPAKQRYILGQAICQDITAEGWSE